jgi:hypothetical protein
MAEKTNRFTREEILKEKFTISTKEWAVRFAKSMAEEYNVGFSVESRHDTPKCIVSFSDDKIHE